jgi:hypothetical protein
VNRTWVNLERAVDVNTTFGTGLAVTRASPRMQNKLEHHSRTDLIDNDATRRQPPLAPRALVHSKQLLCEQL